MFHFLIGRALKRWLEKSAEAAPTPEPAPPPTPEVVIAPLAVVEDAGEDVALPGPEGGSEVVFPRVQRAAMGSLFEIYLAGTDREILVGAGEEALDEIERLDRQLSHYREASDISRLNRHAHEQWVRLEPRLYLLLKRCAALWEETEGAFDITAGPLARAWGFHDGAHRVPSEDEIAALLESVGTGRMLFDDDDNLVYFTAPGMELNLGAVGKGYALDEAAATLRFYGIGRAVVHGGQSSILALGAPPTEDGMADGWEFTVKDPRDHTTPLATVRLRDEALSTSGSYEQFFEVEGVRYTHILDPRTGRPVRGMLGVSVVAPTAAESDALSTAFFVQGREWTQEYCRAHPKIRAVMIEERPDGDIEVTKIGGEDTGRGSQDTSAGAPSA